MQSKEGVTGSPARLNRSAFSGGPMVSCCRTRCFSGARAVSIKRACTDKAIHFADFLLRLRYSFAECARLPGHIDQTTDVLSFAMEDPDSWAKSSISIKRAEVQSRRFGSSFKERDSCGFLYMGSSIARL